MADTLLSKVLETFSYDPDDPNNRTHEVRLGAFIRDEILGVYGAEKFLTRINASLREARLGMPLEGLLSMVWRVTTYPPLTPHLQTYETYVAIREACDRQALHGDSPGFGLGSSEVDHCRVLAGALWIYR